MYSSSSSPPFLFFSPFRTNSLNSTQLNYAPFLPPFNVSLSSSLLYDSPFINLLNYIQHGSCKRLVISLMKPQMLIMSRNLETWRSQKECQEGFPVHLDGCWYAPFMAPFFPSFTLSNITWDWLGASGTGRTTFVNTLCGSNVLAKKICDNPEEAHNEPGITIKPMSVGKYLPAADRPGTFSICKHWI